MQPETAPETLVTAAECRALRAELLATNGEIRARTRSAVMPDGYHENRIARVLRERETSQPLLDAVHTALVEIRAQRRGQVQAELQRRAAAGDRDAMDALDARHHSLEARASAPSTQ